MEEIEVKQNEYRKAQAPDILYSGGIGPCIIVGALHGKSGYMAHMVDPIVEQDLLESLLKDLIKNTRNKRDIKIYLAGGGTESQQDREYNLGILESRRFTIERIAERGFKESIKTVKWNSQDSTQALTLFLSDGRVGYEEDSDENLQK